MKDQEKKDLPPIIRLIKEIEAGPPKYTKAMLKELGVKSTKEYFRNKIDECYKLEAHYLEKGQKLRQIYRDKYGEEI